MMTNQKILSIENNDARVEEIKIQEQINFCIEQKENFKFEAGAGSGKTYALKESLKYILNNNSQQLKSKNQKILCITYTNVAKNEINTDFEHNSLLQVSTIHEFIWDLISSHQNLLYIEHARKIKSELDKLNKELKTSNVLDEVKLDEIGVSSREQIKKLFLKNEFRNAHFENYGKNVSDYRKSLQSVGWKWDPEKGPLSNVNNFKKYLTKYYKYNQLTNTKREMLKGRPNKIKYSNLINRDRLHKYEISHDTVLDYGYKIIKEYELIRKIIVDSYPYILVDEYQDTAHTVIKLFKKIIKEEQTYNKEFMIGFFGDQAQNIYSDGVGEKIDGYLTDLKLVDKQFNRRSCDNIIKVSNKIRNDGTRPISIYDDSDFGEVKIKSLEWKGLDELSVKINQEIESFCNYELPRNSDNIQNIVMMAKHEDLANLSHFGSLFQIVKSFNRYSGANFDRINRQFLTKEDRDLDPLWSSFNELIRLHNISSEDLFSNLLKDSSLLSGITYFEAAQLVRILFEIQDYSENQTIEKYLEFTFSKSEENRIFKKLYQNLISQEDLTLKSFKSQMHREMMTISEDEEKNIEQNNKINAFLSLPFEELISWYNYRKGNYQTTGINYSTMHGTKGAEFMNVILVLDDSFSRRNDYFSYFFKHYNNDFKNGNKNKFIEARNLLYVACSRARVNLTIIIPKEMYDSNSKVIEDIFKRS